MPFRRGGEAARPGVKAARREEKSLSDLHVLPPIDANIEGNGPVLGYTSREKCAPRPVEPRSPVPRARGISFHTAQIFITRITKYQ